LNHVITRENSSEANDAVRDILLMYEGLAGDGLLTHNADWPIRFDPLKFVDAVQDSVGCYYLDMDLLRAGSAMAMAAAFSTFWNEEHGVSAGVHTERYAAAVREGRLRHLPDIEAVLVEFLRGEHAAVEDPWFDEVGARLCAVHVRGYFRRLADGVDSGRGPSDWMLERLAV